jgi:protein-glucosylgalactosylhydroxylysine glucosidase
VNNEIYTNEVAHQCLSVATTSGGFIEAFLYGLSGLRIEEQGLVPEFAPTLPRELSNLKLVNIAFRGQLFDVSISRLPSRQVVRRMTARGSIH